MAVIEGSAPGELLPVQDLIPEVRLRTRRRRLRATLLTLGVAAVVVVAASIAGMAIGAVKNPSATGTVARPGTVLTSSTLGKVTAVGDVQMLTDTHGYAVAYNFNSSHSHYYLVATPDAAKSWRIVAPITGLGSLNAYIAPSIDFVNAQLGYAYSEASNTVVMTVDAGHSWRPLTLDLNALSLTNVNYATTAQIAVATSLRCDLAATPPDKCTTWLSLFRLGETAPYVTRKIPTFAGGVHWMHLLAALGRSTIFVAPETGGPIEESLDNGISWKAVNTPCPTEPTGQPGQAESPSQLTSFSGGPWLLDCIVGVGMNHALNSLWSSPNHGATWHELSYVGVHSSKGNLFGNNVGFTWSNDHRVLYVMWTGANAGVEYSTNGTSWRWTLADSANGGGQEYLTPIGAEGMLYSSPSDVLALSTNGATWHTLRSQPDIIAATPHGLSVLPASVAKHYHYRIY